MRPDLPRSRLRPSRDSGPACDDLLRRNGTRAQGSPLRALDRASRLAPARGTRSGRHLSWPGRSLLDFLAPERLSIGPSCCCRRSEGLLLIGLVAISPHPRIRKLRWRRRIAIALNRARQPRQHRLSRLLSPLPAARQTSGQTARSVAGSCGSRPWLLFELWTGSRPPRRARSKSRRGQPDACPTLPSSR